MVNLVGIYHVILFFLICSSAFSFFLTPVQLRRAAASTVVVTHVLFSSMFSCSIVAFP